MHFPSVVFSYGTYLYFFRFFEMSSCDGICSLAILLTKLLSSSSLSFFFRYDGYNGNTWEDNDDGNDDVFVLTEEELEVREALLESGFEEEKIDEVVCIKYCMNFFQIFKSDDCRGKCRAEIEMMEMIITTREVAEEKIRVIT